jgi:Protein of unknown function (DUF2721)
MVAPVVLLSVSGLMTNGLLTVYSAINDRMRDMTRERLEIRRGPAGQVLDADSIPPIETERLYQISVQLPMLIRRHRLTRASVLVIYAAIVVLGLSVIAIGIAVAQDNEVVGRVALGLVLAGTVILLTGMGLAALSLAKSADAISYAVERTEALR